jgi:hypothetical protein
MVARSAHGRQMCDRVSERGRRLAINRLERGRVPKDILGRPVVTAAQMDAMSPQERREVFRSRIVWDLSELPADYVAALRATAERRLAEREGAPGAGEPAG